MKTTTFRREGLLGFPALNFNGMVFASSLYILMIKIVQSRGLNNKNKRNFGKKFWKHAAVFNLLNGLKIAFHSNDTAL